MIFILIAQECQLYTKFHSCYKSGRMLMHTFSLLMNILRILNKTAIKTSRYDQEKHNQIPLTNFFNRRLYNEEKQNKGSQTTARKQPLGLTFILGLTRLFAFKSSPFYIGFVARKPVPKVSYQAGSNQPTRLQT